MVITGIVVAFAASAIAVTIIVRLYKLEGGVDLDASPPKAPDEKSTAS